MRARAILGAMVLLLMLAPAAALADVDNNDYADPITDDVLDDADEIDLPEPREDQELDADEVETAVLGEQRERDALAITGTNAAIAAGLAVVLIGLGALMLRFRRQRADHVA